MSKRPFSTVTDQVVELLRDGMLTGRWRGTLPGRDHLTRELGVSNTTVEQAMRRLAKQGMLASQGPGKRRRIVLPNGNLTPSHYRVRILVYESTDRGDPRFLDLLDRLNMSGFNAKIAVKSLLDLGMKAERVARFVKTVPADAWIVAAGSREVLEWFSTQPLPAYAYFGVRFGLPIAGGGALKDIQGLVRRFAELGHRRIVLLKRGEHFLKPSLFARQFLDALQQEGIKPGPYHLPSWGFQPAGLHRCLESYFKINPPTALIVGEALMMQGVCLHLAQRGINIPRDMSLACLDQDPAFAWCEPLVAHFDYDSTLINNRVVRWVRNVARGKKILKQTSIMADFVEGGTIGQVPKGAA